MAIAENWYDLARRTQWDPSQRIPLRLPARFAEATPEGIPFPDVRETVLRYFRDFEVHARRGVAPSFFGRAQTYKTYTAAVIARWVEGYQQLEVEFCDAGSEFLYLELQRYNDSSVMRLRRLATVPFLVLDDITNVRPKSVAEALMQSVVLERFGNERPTCYTGNWEFAKNHAAFVETYGPALARRILTGSGDFLVTN